MAARVVDKLPEGDEWLYEVKFDGYRALLLKDGDKVRIRSRNDKDLTHAYPTVAVAGQRLKARQAVLDGEIVAVDPRGHPSFQALQHRAAHSHHVIAFYVFDLLHLRRTNPPHETLLRPRTSVCLLNSAPHSCPQQLT
jgi:bifunctional non-homologous end joining protein LigD